MHTARRTAKTTGRIALLAIFVGLAMVQSLTNHSGLAGVSAVGQYVPPLHSDLPMPEDDGEESKAEGFDESFSCLAESSVDCCPLLACCRDGIRPKSTFTRSILCTLSHLRI